MKIKSLSAACILSLSLLGGLAITSNTKEVKPVLASGAVEYLAYNEQTHDYETRESSDYTVLNSTVLAGALTSGDYVVSYGQNITTEFLNVNVASDCVINIIIEDNATFTIEKSIVQNGTASGSNYSINFFGKTKENQLGKLVIGSGLNSSYKKVYTSQKFDINIETLDYTQYFYCGSAVDYMFETTNISLYGVKCQLANVNDSTDRCIGIFEVYSGNINVFDSTFTVLENATLSSLNNLFTARYSPASITVKNSAMNLTGAVRYFNTADIDIDNCDLTLQTAHHNYDGDTVIVADTLDVTDSTLDFKSMDLCIHANKSIEFTNSTVNLKATAGSGIGIQTSGSGLADDRYFKFNSGSMTINTESGKGMNINAAYFIMNGGTLTSTSYYWSPKGVNPASISLWDGSSFIMNDGELNITANKVDGLYIKNSFEMNGGTLNITSSNTGTDYYAFNAQIGGYLTVNGGTINVYNESGKGINCDSGLNLNGGKLNCYSSLEALTVTSNIYASGGEMYLESTDANALSMADGYRYLSVTSPLTFQYKVNISDADYQLINKKTIYYSEIPSHHVARIAEAEYVFDHFDWATDYSSADAIYVLATDETQTISKTATVTVEHTTAPTCEATGVDTYTATEGSNSETKTVTVEALGHDYQFSSFEWADDYTCKVILVCSRDASHTTKVDATVTSEVTKEPTETETGLRVYTATYETHSDTKEEILPVIHKKPRSTGTISPGGVVGIVFGVLIAAAVGFYFIIFFAVNKWILEGDKAVRVFRFGKKDEQARVVSHKGKIYYREKEKVFKSKKEALDSKEEK